MTGHHDRNGTGEWHTHDEREACPIGPDEPTTTLSEGERGALHQLLGELLNEEQPSAESYTLSRLYDATAPPKDYTPGSWRHQDWCPSPSGHDGDCWQADRRAKGLPDTEPAITIKVV